MVSGRDGTARRAIREHLELKRRSGGDPSAIAREEREAFDPALAEEPTDDAALAAEGTSNELETATAGPEAPASAEHRPEDRVADLAAGGQETAELDMQTVMEDDPDAADPGAPEAPPSDDDLLEWELPGERDREPPPEPIPGQERLSFE